MVVTLEWVRDHYDANKSRYIEISERDVAKNDWMSGIITMEQFGDVQNAYDAHTQLPAYTVAEHAISFIAPMGAILKVGGVEII